MQQINIQECVLWCNPEHKPEHKPNCNAIKKH